MKTGLSSLSSGNSSGIPAVVPPDVVADPSGPLAVFVRNLEVAQGGSLSFKIELNRISNASVVVQLDTVQGTALPLVDYEPIQSSVTIPAGTLSAVFEVPSLVFDIATSAKTMGLRATSSSAGAILQPIGVATIQATQTKLQFTQLSSGLYGVCGVSPAGTVLCWGGGFTAANGGLEFSYIAKAIAGLTGVQSIEGANGALCAILTTGIVKCIGQNSNGIFGNGATADLLAPTAVNGLAGSKKVALGSYIGCALTNDGKTKCWANDGGAYDNGLHTPVEVLEAVGAKDIAVNGGQACAIMADEKLKCWGRLALSFYSAQVISTPHEMPGLSGVKKVAIQGGSACAIVTGGMVKCWHEIPFEELGSGTSDASVPELVLGLSGAKDISMGPRHACVITADDKVKCWGSNANGQLGVEGIATASSPVEVPGVTEAKQVVTGAYFTCAVKADNTAKCWGERFGYTANTTKIITPIATEVTSGLLNAASTWRFGCGVTSGGGVSCWGNNFYGELGRIDQNGGLVRSPALPVEGISGATQVATGMFHSCAILASNRVKCWGWNVFGQLGNGQTINSASPVDVTDLNDAKQLVLDDRTSCAVTLGGGVKCWGRGTQGQLGNGLNANSSTPVEVAGLTGIKHLAGGAGSFCALATTGVVKCWGQNSLGLFGNDLSLSSPVPVEVAALNGIQQLAIGSRHACILTSQGAVKCLGKNDSGQLGNGSNVDSPSMVDVAMLTGVKQVVAGSDFTCALTLTGRVQCWGKNDSGQLGVGNLRNAAVPIDLGIANVKQLAASFSLYILFENGRIRRTAQDPVGSPTLPVDVTNPAF